MKKSIRYEEHGSILRHVILKGVSGQTMSAAVRNITAFVFKFTPPMLRLLSSKAQGRKDF